MYIILVYDIGVERVSNVCKFLRQYVHWVQNSVFEGELTKSEFLKIKGELKKLINSKKDSIIIYRFEAEFKMEREFLGVKKVELSQVI